MNIAIIVAGIEIAKPDLMGIERFTRRLRGLPHLQTAKIVMKSAIQHPASSLFGDAAHRGVIRLETPSEC